MGPVVTRSQQAAAFDGIRRLAGEASLVCGGAQAPALDGIDASKSAFVAPTLLKAKDPGAAQAVHEVEVFGPAATIVPYRDEQDACALIARGGGSLVASIYGEDKDLLARIVSEIGPGTAGFSRSIRRLPPPIPAMASSCRNAITAVPAAPAGRGAGRAPRPALLSPAAGGAGLERPSRERCRRKPRACTDLSVAQRGHGTARQNGYAVLARRRLPASLRYSSGPVP